MLKEDKRFSDWCVHLNIAIWLDNTDEATSAK
jgi:hypothetical protein